MAPTFSSHFRDVIPTIQASTWAIAKQAQEEQTKPLFNVDFWLRIDKDHSSVWGRNLHEQQHKKNANGQAQRHACPKDCIV